MTYSVDYKLLASNADPALCSTARSILAILKSHVHPKKHCAFPTQGYIANILGISTRWVRTCLKQLRELGYIDQLYRNKHKVVAWSVSLTRKWADDVRPVLAMKAFIKAVKRTAKSINIRGYAEQEFLHSKPIKGEAIEKGLASSPLAGDLQPLDQKKKLIGLINQYIDANNAQNQDFAWMFGMVAESIALLEDALTQGVTIDEL